VLQLMLEASALVSASQTFLLNLSETGRALKRSASANMKLREQKEPNRQERGETGQAPNRQELGGTGQAPNRQELGETGQAPNQQKIRSPIASQGVDPR
jgi:hypothetical protein